MINPKKVTLTIDYIVAMHKINLLCRTSHAHNILHNSHDHDKLHNRHVSDKLHICQP